MSAASASDMARFQAHCAACACWCSTSTACSPTGGFSTGPKGELLKAFHVRDGHGIKQVAAAGITVAIISGRKSAAVARRAQELGIRHVTQGATDKLAALRKLAKARGVALEDCVCVGDDTPDAPILAAAGLGIAVADAHQDALAAADLVTHARWRSWRGPRGLRLADRGAQGFVVKGWRARTCLRRGLIAVVALAWFFGARAGATTTTPIPRARSRSIPAMRRATPKSSKPATTAASAIVSRPASSASRPNPGSSTSNNWR